jgi:hypothetical protein
VIDADELRSIIEANSPTPQIVPGTVNDRRRGPRADVVEPPAQTGADTA